MSAHQDRRKLAVLIDREFQNVLIIKPSAAGDIVCALPVLSALRRRCPSARISWLVASHLADLLRDHPLIDEVIEFNRRRFGHMARSWSVTKRFVRFVQQLRSARYDLVLDLQGLFRSGFLAWSTGADVRIGPAEKREMGWVFYTHRCPSRAVDTHTVDRIATVGELLGLDLSEPSFSLPVKEQARARVAEILDEALGDDHNTYVAIAPGGTWPSKRWPDDRFAQLAGRVVNELDLPVVLIGAPAERHLGDEIVKQVGNKRVVNLAGKTSLSELVAVLDGAVALVSNDSGPMHMAVALDRPVTAIIGPTNYHRTGPYRRPEAVIHSDIDCSPCYKRRCARVTSDGEPACMAAISVDEVFDNMAGQIGAS